MGRSALIAFAVLAGCALDKSGLRGNDSLGGNDAESDTAVVESGADTFVVDAPKEESGCDESACGALPGGARPLLLVDAAVACPTGTTSSDVVEKQDASCTCSCGMPTVKPTCPGIGAVDVKYGATTCDMKAPLATTGDGACNELGAALPYAAFSELAAPAPFGGLCGAATLVTPTGATTNKRLCELATATACASSLCASGVVCIETTAATCPADYPNRHVVGSAASPPACPGCGCTLTATCKGTLDYFAMSGCSGTKKTVDVGVPCAASPGGSIASYKFHAAAPSDVACKPTYATAPATVTLTGERTLCCR